MNGRYYGGGMIPTPLQIDGETIPNVTSYEASGHGSCAAGQ